MKLKYTTHRSRFSHFASALLFGAALTVGCVAAIPLVIQIGAALLEVCLENYGQEKKSLLESLLLVLASAISTERSMQEPSIAVDSARSLGGSHSREGTDQGPIGLDVALLKRTMVNGSPILISINDGDIMKDGRGDPQAGDKFRILVRADTDCYLYIVALDATAWVQELFPSVNGSFVNPVRKGQTYTLPMGRNWYSLDQYRGIQHLYFVASHQRRPDIEEILNKIKKLERDPGDVPKTVQKEVVLPNGYGHTRSGQEPFQVILSRGKTEQVSFKTYFAETAGEAVRITRWFRHQ